MSASPLSRRFGMSVAALLALAAVVFTLSAVGHSPRSDADPADDHHSGPGAEPAPLVEPAGGLEHRLTSPDGRWAVSATPLPPGASIYEPGGRATTTIAVEDRLTGDTVTHTYPANLEPEAFSTDGTALYVIDHRPAADPERYRVAGIELASGERFEVLGPDKNPLDEDMRGTGRQQLWSPDGTQLYTLYVRQYHVHDRNDDEAHDGQLPPEAAFVHVLDLEAGWAICLDLPAGFGLGPPGSTSLVLGADGYAITVVDHHLGQRVDITQTGDVGNGLGGFEIHEPRPLPVP